jgi:hypothetical protein
MRTAKRLSIVNGICASRPSCSSTYLSHKNFLRLTTETSLQGKSSGGWPMRKRKKGQRYSPEIIGADGQAASIVGGPAHSGTLEIPGWTGERCCEAKLSSQSFPSREHSDQEVNGAPEGDEENCNEKEGVFVEVVLHGVRSLRLRFRRGWKPRPFKAAMLSKRLALVY